MPQKFPIILKDLLCGHCDIIRKEPQSWQREALETLKRHQNVEWPSEWKYRPANKLTKTQQRQQAEALENKYNYYVTSELRPYKEHMDTLYFAHHSLDFFTANRGIKWAHWRTRHIGYHIKSKMHEYYRAEGKSARSNLKHFGRG